MLKLNDNLTLCWHPFDSSPSSLARTSNNISDFTVNMSLFVTLSVIQYLLFHARDKNIHPILSNVFVIMDNTSGLCINAELRLTVAMM